LSGGFNFIGYKLSTVINIDQKIARGPPACRLAVGLGERADSATAMENVSDVDTPEPALAENQPVFGRNGIGYRIAIDLWRIKPAGRRARAEDHATNSSI
jgi:hypothetical protein